MRRILILFLPLFCMFNSCSKPDKDVDISPVPVFTVVGTLGGGGPVTMAAGENGMYMYTFSREEADGTFSYGGKIARENCENDCGPALEIFLIDTIPFVEQHGESRVWNSMQEILFHGSVLNDSVRCGLGLTNHSYSEHGGLKESWQFNDGCIVQGKLKADYLYFPSAGPVKTTLIMRDAGDNFASIQKTMDYYDPHDSGLSLEAYPCAQGAIIKVKNPDPLQVLEYIWSNDATTDSICVDVYYDTSVHSVTVTDTFGNETVLSCSIKDSGSGISYLQANYSFNLADHDFSISNAWPRVVIRYRDENGKWYDSRNIHQDDYCNYFSIANVQPYQTNYQGLNTKKVEAFFTAVLRDNSQQSIKLEHFKVKFGFGSRE